MKKTKMKLLSDPVKKWKVEFMDGSGTVVRFGQKGAEDYTIHKDPRRVLSYIKRHNGIMGNRKIDNATNDKLHNELLKVTSSSEKEDWSNMKTAGFWSRWLLWSQPSLQEAKVYIAQKFNVEWVK